MEKESEFKRLESYVERMLETYSDIKAENQRLVKDLEEQSSENSRLRAEIEALQAEKGEVSNRVGAIISRIESWESELSVPVPHETAGERGNKKSSGSEEKETIDTDHHGEGDEKAGGVQSSLFVDGNTPTFRTDV